MSLSLNGIKSTGMHPEVQRPAKWRREGCDRERTEKPFGELAGHSNGVEWAVRPNPFDTEGMTHENVSHNLGRAVICCRHHCLRFFPGQRNQVASCRVFLDSAFQHTPRGDRGAGGEPRRPKRYRPRNARLRACLSVASGSLFGKRVGRVWVYVAAKHVRRHIPLCCFGYLQHPFGGNAIALPLAHRLTRNPKGNRGCGIGREIVENFHG